MRSGHILTLLLVAPLLACGRPAQPAQPPDTSAADREAVLALGSAEAAAVGSGDVEAFVKLFADDAIAMPPNEEMIQGKEAARAWLENLYSQFSLENVEGSSVEVIVSGDLAIERYAWSMTMIPADGGDPIEDSIKGIHVSRRQADGSWKIIRDVWNSDMPPPEGGAH